MADSKPTRSSSPKSKPSSAPRTTASKPGATIPARTTSQRSADPNAPKLVRAESRPASRPRREVPAEPEFHPWLDPERLGKLLHERPAWLDEVFAIMLVVFGFVSIFSLLNTSPNAALSNIWSGAIRQLFGYNGALIASGMIIAAGVLIILPRVGIRLSMPWSRIIVIEIAYFAFLGLLHLLAHDPEPRALARNGLGGGYIGWALSEPMFKLFGSGLATTIFTMIIVISLSNSIGIRRRHLRDGLLAANKRFEALAERLKRPPQPRRVKPVAVEAMAQRQRAFEGAAAAPVASEPAVPVRYSEPIAPRPAPTAPDPTVVAGAPNGSRSAMAAGTTPDVLTDTPPDPVPLESATKLPVKPKVPSRPLSARPPLPEKRKRYFTVEDFKETRQLIPRSDDLPPLSMLSDMELNKPTEQEINTNVRLIENTLLEFDIDVEVVDVKVGPTVTQYAVQPFREVTNDQGEVVMQRVRVNKIASLSSDLALALSAKRLRIQPYVPGHPYMGIEVPNRTPSMVGLRPVMESETFAKGFVKRDPEMPNQTREVPLTVPLGRDVSGAAFVVDLATMPHVLIAGTTGSGKSVCITAIATALVLNNAPDRLNLVMLDPKMVELTRFNGLPHLLGPVETDIERIIGVLRWATREMDRRYKLLEGEAARNIEAYNRALGKRRQAEHLPYIVILIDEIGDLMLTKPEEMERTLTRLAQMARAVGMHLVVATQRPSVDIITGLIKANFPARISFAVASGTDSRVILDTTGAETLMGRGDMLYLSPDAAGPQRLQGCYVSDDEIDKVIAHWKDWEKRRLQNDPTAVRDIAPWERGLTRRESHNDTDPLLEDAIDLVVREGEASASLIQRRLGIGYPRAAQLLDMLADLGVVGSLKDGGRSREVLLKPGMDKYKKLMEKRRRG